MDFTPIILQDSDDHAHYHASFHGGGFLGHVNLYLIFWGSDWADPKTKPSSAQIVEAVESILKGPYMSALSQYGIGRGALRGVVSDTAYPWPSSPFASDTWKWKIWQLIDRNIVPGPDWGLTTQNLYMFVLQRGVTSADPGAHGTDWRFNLFKGVKIVCGGFVTIPALGDASSALAQVTQYLSHEIVEACTDATPGAPYDGFDGWTLDKLEHPHSEICDKCQSTIGIVNGVSVQGYWSNAHNCCVIPRLFSLRNFLVSKGLDPNKGLRVLNPPPPSVLGMIHAG